MTPVTHRKTCCQRNWITAQGLLSIEGPVSSEALASYDLAEGLCAFRPASQQKKALVEIAALPEGRVVIARRQQQVVGYVTYLYPDSLERWSRGHMHDLLELGAIETTRDFRGMGVAKALLALSFQDNHMEDYIVFSTEYYWHWDLEGTGLSLWKYQEMMKRIMGSVGMQVYATDDPEITSHPANMLMARIGSRVPLESQEKFHRLRFTGRQMF